ncbi:hypothetical protein [Aeromonas rivipollensis]|uniref:hypothetical protein n=1 Tax=Aeromonas rivipollensis TaxID=948519 RepID=UPI003D204B44
MSEKKSNTPDKNKKSPSGSRSRVAQESYTSISEDINWRAYDTQITQSCATPPRPKKTGSDESGNNGGK